ncbi:MAG TPA: Nif3-like dinuclear metal center hexameric protein [Deltaproteobacteria bacterium]|nr:Nif3-like dinuclear metal center hexameric protein [Deltaproteobacteria bacterium]
MQLKDVLTILDGIAPFATAEEWDNVGLMVGDPAQEVRSVLVALDPTVSAIEEAVRQGVDLIITHHPLIMSPIKRLDLAQGAARKIGMLIRTGISLVSMHTNLDAAPGGVADVFAERLSLQDVQSLGPLRLGTIPAEMPLDAWARALPFEDMRIVDAGRSVKHISACPGSGMSYLKDAIEKGCDTLVTGDVRYHAALDAFEAGVNVVDLGHFNTEQIALEPLARRLRREMEPLSVQVHTAQDIFTTHKGEHT